MMSSPPIPLTLCTGQQVGIQVHGRLLWDFESAHIDFSRLTHNDIGELVTKMYNGVFRAVARRIQGHFQVEKFPELPPALCADIRQHVSCTAFMRSPDYEAMGKNVEVLRACGVHVFCVNHRNKDKEVIDCVIRDKMSAIPSFRGLAAFQACTSSHQSSTTSPSAPHSHLSVMNIPLCGIIANDMHYLDSLTSFYKAHPSYLAQPVTLMVMSESFFLRDSVQRRRAKVPSIKYFTLKDFFLRWSGPLDREAYMAHIATPCRVGGEGSCCRVDFEGSEDAGGVIVNEEDFPPLVVALGSCAATTPHDDQVELASSVRSDSPASFISVASRTSRTPSPPRTFSLSSPPSPPRTFSPPSLSSFSSPPSPPSLSNTSFALSPSGQNNDQTQTDEGGTESTSWEQALQKVLDTFQVVSDDADCAGTTEDDDASVPPVWMGLQDPVWKPKEVMRDDNDKQHVGDDHSVDRFQQEPRKPPRFNDGSERPERSEPCGSYGLAGPHSPYLTLPHTMYPFISQQQAMFYGANQYYAAWHHQLMAASHCYGGPQALPPLPPPSPHWL